MDSPRYLPVYSSAPRFEPELAHAPMICLVVILVLPSMELVEGLEGRVASAMDLVVVELPFWEAAAGYQAYNLVLRLGRNLDLESRNP